jgi:hypothetical protein
MATFVRLTENPSGDLTFVNMNRVISMERQRQGNYTSLFTNINPRSSISVSETPDQIVEMIRHEKKSQA